MEFQNRCQKFSEPFRLTEYILVLEKLCVWNIHLLLLFCSCELFNEHVPDSFWYISDTT